MRISRRTRAAAKLMSAAILGIIAISAVFCCSRRMQDDALIMAVISADDHRALALMRWGANPDAIVCATEERLLEKDLSVARKGKRGTYSFTDLSGSHCVWRVGNYRGGLAGII